MGAVTRELARYAVASRFEDLPETVRHEGERAFVNILGCMLGGAKADGIDRLLVALQEFSGCPEATLIGRGQRTDILLATLVNAHSQGANAYNDTHLATVAHSTGPPSCAICIVDQFDASFNTRRRFGLRATAGPATKPAAEKLAAGYYRGGDQIAPRCS